ncbi:MAG: hypothetical protein HGB12_00170 [Bacteroidetes bacterium]|nr:hypothetical protein [Bacteroidota bacterium]
MYRIKVTPCYYRGSLPPHIDHWYNSNPDSNCDEYETEAEAQLVIDNLEDGTYYLAHGEADRPTYEIVDTEEFSYGSPNPYVPDDAVELDNAKDAEIIEELLKLNVQPYQDGMRDDSNAEYFEDTIDIDDITYGIMYAVDPLDVADHSDDLGGCDWSRYVCYRYNY